MVVRIALHRSTAGKLSPSTARPPWLTAMCRSWFAVCDQLQGWRVRVEDSHRAPCYSTTPPLPNHSAAKPESPKHSAATTESTSQSFRSALETRRSLSCTTASLPRNVESFSTRVSEPTPTPSCGVDKADAVWRRTPRRLSHDVDHQCERRTTASGAGFRETPVGPDLKPPPRLESLPPVRPRSSSAQN
jgi:hypothetical protein